MKKPFNLAVLPGDGIGPEVTDACLPILYAASRLGGHEISVEQGLVGWAAYDVHKDVMPEQTWGLLRRSDGVLLYAMGLPERDPSLPPDMRPERRALLPIRREYGLSTNIRPIKVHPGLEHISPLRADIVRGGLEVTCFRELVGGDYFGKKEVSDPPGQWAADECRYTRAQIQSIARAAFAAARASGKSVTSIDKANVLGATGTFWRKVVSDLHQSEFADVTLHHQFVDSAAALLVSNPRKFEILLASNAYGDILSDEMAAISGSLGLLPSASLDPASGYALYEPGGGSAPDIAGQNIANPIAFVLSIAMLFRYSLKDEATASRIEAAVAAALNAGCRTKDIASGATNESVLSTTEMAKAILDRLE
jgi:3-isopropylmalate dehydrogenase